jgi:hypothetical protein
MNKRNRKSRKGNKQRFRKENKERFKSKRKEAKEKYKQLNKGEPQFPERIEEYYEIGEIVYYLSFHDPIKTWKKGKIINANVRSGGFIVFDIEDLNTPSILLPIRKNMVSKIDQPVPPNPISTREVGHQKMVNTHEKHRKSN